MQKLPPFEEIKAILEEARKRVRLKYLSELFDWDDLLEAFEYAYSTFVLPNLKDINKLWNDLAFYTFGILTDNRYVSDCNEAFEILTQNGKDCKLEEFRQVVDEAGLVSSFEIDEIDPIYLAETFISSKIAVDLDKLTEVAKQIWLEKQNLAKN